ncbi:Leu/Phe/Val dehydrogenase [Azospirillum picis]|uniref:Leucine dehydrogenase n=1 Tax=Azospirillum picis TaxID=488438 RepID=A0ABU0MI14_9PROT|nr:Glu/Leu/Phe/Val dehydrogenase dimerization domain-containing protein [Azospirillum picis]MBP2298805.1 leucine dehydrogenase [Azospirillum picis]MDQ0532953.1 leucine dehydrogenase [Azospirillum picis]
MSVFEHCQFDNHEAVYFCRDEASGLCAIIALHSTLRGPAMGGTRMVPYASDEEALTDVLRLSRGMTFKNVMAGLPFGGGKAVIIGDPAKDKSAALLQAYAVEIERLQGRFVTGEDVGIGMADVQAMSSVTAHIRGVPDGGAGDPSPFTASGVYDGIVAAVRHRLDRGSVEGIHVLVQGLGAVGMRLAERLFAAGARLSVTDTNPNRVEEARERFAAEAVDIASCCAADVDVYAPCALGATLDAATIPTLKASVVAGGANNQLATAEDGRRLHERGILYAPDYVINAGGVISTAHAGPSFDMGRMLDHVGRIAGTLEDIFRLSKAEGLPTSVIADRLARKRLADAAATTR